MHTMPSSVLDWISKLGANFMDRVVVPLFAVDDTPPTYADGQARPARLDKTNGGVIVHVANSADISGGGSTLPDLIDIGGGQLVLPVGVLAGDVGAIQSGMWTVSVSNFAADPATNTSQVTANGHLSDIKTAVQNITQLPPALSDGALIVTDANIVLVSTAVQSIDTKTPALVTGRVPVDGSGVTQPVSMSGTIAVDTELPAAAALSDTLANPTAPMVGASMLGYNTVAMGGGNTWARIPGNSTGGLVVQGATAIGSTQAGNGIPALVFDPGNLARRMAADTSGRIRPMLAGAAPHADATTDVYTQLIPTAFTSGVAVVKATAGRVRHIHVIYTAATASGLYLQLHNAANATALTDATLRWSVKIDTTNLIVDRDFVIDIPCSAGIKLAFSSTAGTYTAATAETGIAVAHYS
jgi:hypothetical protein